MGLSKKIAVIVPYFGRLPNTFLFWLTSCISNPQIDWFLFTDQKIVETLCNGAKNVHITNCKLVDVKNEAQKNFDFPINLETPYKLCDYKSLYGNIFRDCIRGYAFWGYCDMDMIFGNISSYITDELLEKYDKLFRNGHFSIYKNSPDVNHWWETLASEKELKSVFQSKETCCFDEWGAKGITEGIASLSSGKTFYEEWFDDIKISTQSFWCTRNLNGVRPTKKYCMIYEYNQGKLYRHTRLNKRILVDESMYVHIQKRHLTVCGGVTDHFWIVPDSIIDDCLFDRKNDYHKALRYRGFRKEFLYYRMNNLKKKINKKIM